MPRSLVLGLVLLASLDASAALPIAPLEQRISPATMGADDPAAATNGTTTLVAWTLPNGRLTGPAVQVRLLGVHDAAVQIGGGSKPQVGWNGYEYLVADSFGATIVHDDGAIGTRRELPVSTVNAVAWNGHAWVVGLVRDAGGFVLLLDRALNVVRTIELGPARSVRLTTIDGAVWAVRQRESDTEVFAVDGEETRFRVGGHARMIGPMAVIEETLHLSFLDPLTGFSEPRPFMASTEVPLELVHAAPFGSGAVFAIYSPVFRTLLLVEVDAHGSMQEYGSVLESSFAPRVAVAGTRIFLAVRSQIYGFPLQPWPRQPFALADDAIVSLIDFASRSDATIVPHGTDALVFWNERTGNVTTASFMRAVDANGVPFGPVTQLPFSFSNERDAASYGDRFVLVWRRDDGTLYASAGGEPVVIGHGGAPAVARGPHGSFAVWRNQDGGISGTPLRDDASPLVPGGFVISSAGSDSGPAIAAVPQGFLVLSSREGIFISPAGIPLVSFPIGPEGAPAAGGELLAWRNGTLMATAGGESYVPQWAGGWVPLAIHPMDGGRHLVILLRDRTLFTSIVTLAGGRIVSDTAPRLLLDRVVHESSIAVVDEKPLVVYHQNGQIWVATYPGRRRAAR